MVKAKNCGKYSVDIFTERGLFIDEVRTAQKYLYKGVLHLYGVSESRLHPMINTVKIFPNGKIEYYRNKAVVNESKPCDMLLEALTAGLI